MALIIGIGVDVVEVERIEQSLRRFGDRFLRRVFTPVEVEYCRGKAHPSENFAARFAAKEAVLKALGTGWTRQTSFREVEVIRVEGSAPTVEISSRMRRLLPPGPVRIWLSISHTSNYAVAQAIITREDASDNELV